jgi:hypothetical protein
MDRHIENFGLMSRLSFGTFDSWLAVKSLESCDSILSYIMCAKVILILAVLAGLSLNIDSGTGHRDAKSSPEHVQVQIEDVPIISWLQSLPSVGRGFARFLLNPREFTVNWVTDPLTRPSPWTALVSSLTAVAFLYTIYAAVFRSTPLHRLWPGPPAEEGKGEGHKRESKPRIVGFGMKFIEAARSPDGVATSYGEYPGIAFGMTIPEVTSKGTHVPQVMIFRLGVLNMVVADMIPDSFTTKSTQALFLIIFALIATICSFPIAWLLGTTSTLSDVFAFTISTFTFSFLFWSLLILLAVLLVIDILKIDVAKRFQCVESGSQFAISSLLVLLWVAIAFLPVTRSIYVSYKELYSVSHWQMIMVFFGSMVLSVLIAPVIFVPFYYVWLKVRNIFEAIA